MPPGVFHLERDAVPTSVERAANFSGNLPGQLGQDIVVDWHRMRRPVAQRDRRPRRRRRRSRRGQGPPQSRQVPHPVGSVETSSRCARPGRRTEVDQPEMVVDDSDPALIDGDPLDGNSLAAQRAVGCRARVARTGTGCPARTRTRAGRVRAACGAMPRSTHGGSPQASCRRRRCYVRRIPSRPCPSLPGPLAVEADADDSGQRTAHPACVSPPGLRINGASH
jgi:hypothetical protein